MITNELIYFIVNPNAKSGLGLSIWKEVHTKLKEAKLKIGNDYDVFFTQAPIDASRMVGELTKPELFEDGHARLLLCVIGGDGTLDEVVNGLHKESAAYIRMIYIPAGSGNDFARSTGVGIRPDQILDAIEKKDQYISYDYGRMEIIKPVKNVRCFVESAGIGYDAAVCHAIHKSTTKKLFNRLGIGKLSYTMIGLMQILKTKPVDGWLETDDGRIEFEKMYFTAVHIHPYEGGGYKFCPDADGTDGLLDVCLVSGISKLGFVAYLLHVLTKSFAGTEGRYCRHFQSRKVKIHVNRPKAVHCDGELMGYQNQVAFICNDKSVNVVKNPES